MISLTPHELASEIRMTRTQFSGSFLIVEGRDDRLFMVRFVALETCQIRVAYGKQNVCDTIDILDEDLFSGALGLIDADFDRIEGISGRSQNIVMPECHDLMTMLVCSPALTRVARELGSEEKLESLGKTILESLIEIALPIGYLRLHSIRAGLNLRFMGLTYSRWIDTRPFQADTDKLIEAVKNHSQKQNLASDVLEKAIAGLQSAKYDPREICVGTDLVEALSIGLRGALGSKRARDVGGELLRSNLRLAYSDVEFRASTLMRDIEQWQSQNPRFQVLRSNLTGG